MIASLVILVTGVMVLPQACPGVPADHGMGYSCYVPQTKTIYLAKQDRHNRMTLFHEYGHAYDFEMLRPADRARFRRVLGYRPGRGWWQETRFGESPGEQFAESYAECAVGVSNRVCRFLPMLSAVPPRLTHHAPFFLPVASSGVT